MFRKLKEECGIFGIYSESKEENVSSELENIDKSFYTSSLGFTDSDFEDLKSLGEDIKKHNGLLKILIVSIIVIVIIIVIFLCFQLLNK